MIKEGTERAGYTKTLRRQDRLKHGEGRIDEGTERAG